MLWMGLILGTLDLGSQLAGCVGDCPCRWLSRPATACGHAPDRRRDRVHRTQTLQLQESRTENTQLREAHADVVQKLEAALAQLRAKTDSEETLTAQVMQLESRLTTVVSEKDTSLSRSRLNERAHAEEIARKTKEFEIQESRLATAEDGLQRLRTERQELIVQLEAVQHELKLEKDNHAYTRSKWDMAEQQLSSHRDAEANHFRLHTQLEQLKVGRVQGRACTQPS